MKLYAAMLVLAIAPAFAAAKPAGADMSQPETVNRASSHDRHHRRHASKIRHKHHQVPKHHSQH
jgi:hypothetical protein